MKESTRYGLCCLASVVVSVAGIIFAVFATRNAADGGRGGAIGVSIALLFFFLNRDYGTKLYTKLIHDLPELKARLEQEGKVQAPAANAIVTPVDTRLAQLEKEVSTLVRRISIEAEGQRTQNIFLAVATAVGTIVWGFGDMLARCLINHFPAH
jgi:hypothetical protein